LGWRPKLGQWWLGRRRLPRRQALRRPAPGSPAATEESTKFEIRNPTQIRMLERGKFETFAISRLGTVFRPLPFSNFGFVSGFEFRNSILFPAFGFASDFDIRASNFEIWISDLLRISDFEF
jgi:hypothetical protein